MTSAVQQIIDEIAPQIFQRVDAKLRDQDNSLLGLCFRVNYSDQVSNTHSCPRNGVTNWNKHSHKPTGYPGFSGRVWARYAHKVSGFGSDVFSGTDCHTGTGGCGGYEGPWETLISQYWKARRALPKSKQKTLAEPVCFSWDVKIFLDDWTTDFQELFEAQQMMCEIKKEPMPTSARWFVDLTPESDNQILQAYSELEQS